jgi:hypothetical protein
MPEMPVADPMKRKLQAGVLAAWRGGDEDGERLLKLLRDLTDLRKEAKL